MSGCISSAARAAHSSTAATNEFFFSKQACGSNEAAGDFLNQLLRDGMVAIEPSVNPKMVVGKTCRRGGVTYLLLHPQLRDDLLPGTFLLYSPTNSFLPLTNSPFSLSPSSVYGRLGRIGVPDVYVFGGESKNLQAIIGE